MRFLGPLKANELGEKGKISLKMPSRALNACIGRGIFEIPEARPTVATGIGSPENGNHAIPLNSPQFPPPELHTFPGPQAVKLLFPRRRSAIRRRREKSEFSGSYPKSFDSRAHFFPLTPFR